jgi:hypothetical protein
LSLLSKNNNLGFLTEGKPAAILITPSSWGSQRAGCSPRTRTSSCFSGAVAGEIGRLLRGEFSHANPLLCFICFALLYLFYLHHFISKTQKKIRILGSCFYLFAFSFVKMNNPEVEVRSFKQQGGESLKDALYRINNAHHRCTIKHSTTILLRNFYVGISSWNRYVLDTLTGGNFLGAPAGEVMRGK